MKLIFKEDKNKLDLLKAMASKDKETSIKAQEAFASLVGPVIPQILNQEAVSSKIFTDHAYNMDDTPSIPLDLFQGNDEGLFQVWSTSTPGGAATNEVWGSDDYRFKTYKLESAISFSKVYARQSRLDVVAKAIERLTQEILVKQEYQAFSALLTALAEGRTPAGGAQVINSTAVTNSWPRDFKLDDVNRLWTLIKRLRTSWVGGSPVAVPGKGLTDLFLSPEMMEKVRAMGYNPVNTTAHPDSNESTALGLPESMRAEIFQKGGMSSIFNVNLNEILEFGVGQSYNLLFDQVYTPTGGDPTFNGATQEIVVGADLSLDFAVRVIAKDSDTGSTFTLEQDDQFIKRAEKIGYYGSLEEGRLVLDSKCLVGVIV